MTFDPRLICSALDGEHVRYVLIGGFAAAIHGSPLPTSDVDIVPARDGDNLERLARALNRLNARLRTEAGPVDVRIAALDDIIDSKRAAARAKDEHALPYLESLRDEVRRRGGNQPT